MLVTIGSTVKDSLVFQREAFHFSNCVCLSLTDSFDQRYCQPIINLNKSHKYKEMKTALLFEKHDSKDKNLDKTSTLM